MDALFELIGLLIPVIVGLMSKPIFTFIKTKLIPFIGGFPDWAQQILVVVQAWGLIELGNLLMVTLPDSLQLLELGHVEAMLGALFAMLRHLIEKGRQPTPIAR